MIGRPINALRRRANQNYHTIPTTTNPPSPPRICHLTEKLTYTRFRQFYPWLILWSMRPVFIYLNHNKKMDYKSLQSMSFFFERKMKRVKTRRIATMKGNAETTSFDKYRQEGEKERTNTAKRNSGRKNNLARVRRAIKFVNHCCSFIERRSK